MRRFSLDKRDLQASIVVFLVALPLSLGIALASGAPPVAGIIAATVGGTSVGLTGGAPLLVSGPAAGLAVIAFDLIERFGFAWLCSVTAVAGVLQFLIGRLKVAHLATAIAPAVLHGMLAGIGMSIAASQVHVVLGGAPQSAVWTNLTALPARLAGLNPAALGLGGLTVATLLLWPKLGKAAQRLPAQLAAVAVATAAAVLFDLAVPRVKLPTSLLPTAWPVVPHGTVAPFVGAALALAFIASAESLLSAVAVDKLHGGRRADLNRELCGQGVGNFLSGLLGGLPVTGVIVRSTANISAGAVSRHATILHGVWVLLAVTFGARVLAQVPLATLGGLLLVMGLRLMDLRQLRRLHAHGEALPFLATLLGVVGINLLAGIGLGLAVSTLQILWRLVRPKVAAPVRTAAGWEIHVEGAVTFVAVPALLKALAGVPQGDNARVQVRAVFIDHAAKEALDSWKASHERSGGAAQIVFGTAAVSIS